MCWVCIPTCGGCRPPRKRMLQCPTCGEFTLVDLQIGDNLKKWQCVTCGQDITAGSIPDSRYCIRFDVECPNPCGFWSRELADARASRCKYHDFMMKERRIG